MPDYEAHIWLARKVGIVIGCLLAGVAFVGGLLSPLPPDLLLLAGKSILIGVIGYYSTLVGGVAPDIDLSQPRKTLKYASIPYRKVVKLAEVLVLIILLFAFVRFTRDSVFVTQTVTAIVTVSLGIVVIRAIPDILHRFMPAHRKLTHELSFWGLTGILGVLAIQKLLQWIWVDPFIQTFLPIGVGLPIFLGVVTHLLMDTVQTYVREYAPDPLKQRAAQLAPWVPKYKPIFVDIPQLARIALDRTAPRSIRLFVLVTALYGIIPLDLIPDTIIGIGWTEDLAIYLGLRRTVYSGYQHGEGVTGSLKRQLTTVLKIYVPVLILSLFAIFAYFEFMS